MESVGGEYTRPVWNSSLKSQAGKRMERSAVRTVPMEVLSFGMSRTGTVSMCEALKLIGIENPYREFFFFRQCLEESVCVAYSWRYRRFSLHHPPGRRRAVGEGR